MSKCWTADGVLALTRGYQEACVLFAAAELDVFDALVGGPMTAEALAGRLGCDVRAMTVLADALAAMELLDKSGRAYSLAPGVADTLTKTSAGSVLSLAQHGANCLRRWAQLARVARTGKPARRGPSIRGPRGDLESFINAMNDINQAIAAPLVAELGPPRFRHLLDVGGGSGTWTIALLRAAPGARATIVDLPEVIPLARKRIGEAGLSDRVTLVGGDFTRCTFPAGADLAWVSAIVHQNSRRENRALFRKTYAALAGGGRILIRDIVMDESRTRPASGAMFAVNMLVATPRGGTFTLGELSEDLAEAGFADPALLKAGQGMDSVVGAVKSEKNQ